MSSFRWCRWLPAGPEASLEDEDLSYAVSANTCPRTRLGMWTGKQPPNQVRSKYASSAVKMIANYESCSTIHPLESCQNRPMKMQSGWQHRWHGTSPGKTPQIGRASGRERVKSRVV